MARKRPTALDLTQPVLVCLDGGRSDDDGPLLTRAETHALRRSAPLTHTQLKRHFGPAPPPPRRTI